MTDAEKIMQMFDLCASACQVITEADGCDRCPLKAWCLDDEHFTDIAYGVTTKMIQAFLDFSDELYDHESDEDIKSYNDWLKEGAERDEYYD